MKGVLESLFLLLLLGQPTVPRPIVPHDSVGACPFECCEYREWTVERDTDILSARHASARVAFRVHAGDTVKALTGVVVTTKLGRVVVRKPIEVGTLHPTTVTPGAEILVLHYIGEGYWRYWLRGYFDEDQIPDSQGGCRDETGREGPCPIELAEEPETTWWVKVRSRSGKEGWTQEVGRFGGMDACG